MAILQTIILGIIEGLTEFLPISSTGHLILANKILGFSQTEFAKTFEIVIQGGAILSVVVLYWRKFLNKEILKRLFVAFVPTAILGFLLYKIIKGYLLNSEGIVLWALLLGGIVLILLELFFKSRKKENLIEDVADISFKKSFLIGCCQSLAIVPGVSRSGATIMGGLLSNISRKAIVEFSFLLAVPTMAAATGYDLLKSGVSFSGNQIWVLLLGVVVSFLVALIAIKFLIKFVQKNSFIGFGVYRIILALVFLIFIF